jgi:uncharacterized NAD(P)/FAD-binding protein YdhS
MTSDRRTAVAIVGGGASGTILAAQLARRGIRSLLIDGSGRMGRGVAYSTTEAAHLLNVRAEGMSALAGDPSHFARRFETEGGDPRGFAQRRFFATYLGEILAEAVASGCTEFVETTAVSAARYARGWKIGFADGSSVEAAALVLAVGNQEPEGLGAFSGVGRSFVGNPWGEAARAAVGELTASGGAALIVGTGLTMVDLVLSLDAAGHAGRIVALSRRGLIPRSHADFDAAPVDQGGLPRGLQPMFRWVRRRSAEVGWRAAIDSLRPYSHALWQDLTGDEQRRFLRHARPWWDVHRHRIAPEVAGTVAKMIGSDQLEVVAGRIISAREVPQGVEVEYRRRAAVQSRTETFAYVFNCTGPLHSIKRSKDPLLQSLLGAEEVKPDHLGIGLEVSQECRAGTRLWAMGPLTKGRYWEIIAVPDIREQAAAVADDIQRELNDEQ